MAFEEVIFPTDISFGAIGGPEYSTDIVVNHGGFEQRNSNWTQARARYDVSHGIKTQQQLDTLISFFRARQGRVTGFRFKDFTDFSTAGQLIGTGDDSTDEFQLVKSYTSGGQTENRVVSKPVTGTVKIYFDAVEQLSGWSVDTTTGIVSFTSPPANAVNITADFEFDVPVRFDTDSLSARIDDFGMYSWDAIPLIEVRTL